MMQEKQRSAKAQRVLLVGFYVLFLLITGIWYAIGVWGTRIYTYEFIFAFLVITMLAILLFWLFSRFGTVLTNRRLAAAAVLCFALLFLLQLRAADRLEQEPAWDPGGVFISAKEWVEEGAVITHENYFNRFPNNNGLFLLEVAYFKVLEVFGLPITMYNASLLNILFIDLAIFFMILFARRIWDNGRAFMCLIVSMVFTPYILYVPVVYTDTMSMPFITASLYMLACWQAQSNRWLRLVQLLTISLLLSFGIEVKGSVVILLVAMVVYLICKFPWKRWLAAAALLILPLFLVSTGVGYLMRAIDVVTEDSELYKFPTEYWIYMGLKTPGEFNMEDFNEIYEQPNLAAKTETAREGIKQRLADYDLKGFVYHIEKKAAFTYGEGTYYAGVKLEKGAIHRDSLWYACFAVNGQYNSAYYIVSNSFQGLVLILLLIGMCRGFKKHEFDVQTLMYIALFGLSLFLMIWETRSRYLVNFTPLMLILAIDSLMEMGKFIFGWIKRRMLLINQANDKDVTPLKKSGSRSKSFNLTQSESQIYSIRRKNEGIFYSSQQLSCRE